MDWDRLVPELSRPVVRNTRIPEADPRAVEEAHPRFLCRAEGIVLSIEHRAAASPEPMLLSLVADAGPVRLEILDQPVELPLAERLLRILDDGEPRRLEDLRQTLRAR